MLYKGNTKRKRELISGMPTNFERWFPAYTLPESVSIKSIVDTPSGLQVVLFDENSPSQGFELFFSFFYGYRNFNESERLMTFRKSSELMVKWSFFIANDSEFIEWFCKESDGVVDKTVVTHYVITTPDDLFEVLAPEPPSIKAMKLTPHG